MREYPDGHGSNHAALPAAGPPSSRLGDLGTRILIAVPAAAATVVVVLQGGIVLAVALGLLAAAAALEVFRLLEGARPATAAGVAAVAMLPLAALYGGVPAAMLVFLAAIPVAFALRAGEPGAAASVAATALGVAWVGLPLAHGVLLRELPDGEQLVIGVLVGTFLGDTAAHLVGAGIGRVQIAPRLSPRKSLEGLLAGIVVGTASLWAFMAIVDAPLRGVEAGLVGLAVAVAAPVGDLFESAFKRDAGVKDTGTALGPHGGVLDRVDAVLFTVVAAYYVTRALL